MDEFTKALWEAIAIVLAVSLVSLGARAGAVVAVSIPLVLAAVFASMLVFDIGFQRISLGALIIALGLLVDDAMITIEAMVTRLERGDEKEHAAAFAYSSTAFPMLTGTLVTIAGFVPIGFAASAAGEYTFTHLRGRRYRADCVLDRRGAVHPVARVWMLKRPKVSSLGSSTARSCAGSAASWRWRCGDAGSPSASRSLCSLPRSTACAWCRSSSFRPRTGPSCWSTCSCRRTPRSTPRRTRRPGSTSILDGRSPTSTIGAPTWARAPCASICRSTSSSPTISSPRPSSSPRASSSASGCRQDWSRRSRTTSRAPSVRICPLELGPPVGWPLQYRVSGPDPAKCATVALPLAEVVAADPRVAQHQLRLDRAGARGQGRVDQDQARLLGLSSQADRRRA